MTRVQEKGVCIKVQLPFDEPVIFKCALQAKNAPAGSAAAPSANGVSFLVLGKTSFGVARRRP